MAREIEGAAGFDLRDPSIYRHWSRITIRFSDEDRMGHVNNAVYSVWLEACRVEYLYSLFDPSDELDTVLARIIVDFIKETHYPGEVDVGILMTAIGSKSITSGYGVFQNGECLATAIAVNVFFDSRTRTSRSPPDSVRERVLAEIAAARASGGVDGGG